MANKCIHCGACERVCERPIPALIMTPDGPVFDTTDCIRCGHCVAVCPVDAISHPLIKPGPVTKPLPDYETAMNFLRSARSVRLYKQVELDEAIIRKLMEAGRYPQTAANTQGISYIVVNGTKKVEELKNLFLRICDENPDDPGLAPLAAGARACVEKNRDVILRGCSAVIFALSDKNSKVGRENAHASLIYMANIAPTLGLGTCWAGLYEIIAMGDKYGNIVSEYIGVPDGKKIQGIMMLGVPDVTFLRLAERDPIDVCFI